MRIEVKWMSLCQDRSGPPNLSGLIADDLKVTAYLDCDYKEYELASSPVTDGTDFEGLHDPLDPFDRDLVDEVCQEAFGVGLAPK